MEDFYVVLPSNVKSVTDERNTTSRYKTYLPKTFTLDKRHWRVALVELDFPYTWTNISPDSSTIYVTDTESEVRHGSIPVKHYTDENELIEMINTILLFMNSKSSLEILPGSIVSLTLGSDEKIRFHPTLAHMLGFTVETLNNMGKDRKVLESAERRIDLHVNLYNAYLYSDIVESTLVGDVFVPLLRTMPIHHEKYGTVKHYEFVQPHYFNLQTGIISVIEIRLCDSAGNSIRFERGTVIAKLHFKKI